jgi:PmbA protein
MGTIAKRESLGRAELESLVTFALDEARKLGVDQAEVVASQDTGLSATARLGEVESLEYTNDRGIGITVFKDQCKGSASTSDVSPDAIRETVAKACSFAKVTARDEFAGLADAELMCKDVKDLDLDHPWKVDANSAIAMAIDAEAAGLEHDKRISNSEGASVSTNRGTRAYGNTHGFVGSYSRARSAEDLDEAAEVGQVAGRKVISRLGARKIETTRAPVLYVPDVARGFMGHAISAIAGGAQYRRSSFLLDAVGEKLFPEFVNIQERPHLPRAMASAPYDGEGAIPHVGLD